MIDIGKPHGNVDCNVVFVHDGKVVGDAGQRQGAAPTIE